MLGKKTGGRAKGTPNKLTADAKDAVEYAFDSIGGVLKFSDWAEKNQTEFYKIWSKLLPKDVQLSGKAGDAITINFYHLRKKLKEERAEELKDSTQNDD